MITTLKNKSNTYNVFILETRELNNIGDLEINFESLPI